jgi:hypothetical protein
MEELQAHGLVNPALFPIDIATGKLCQGVKLALCSLPGGLCFPVDKIAEFLLPMLPQGWQFIDGDNLQSEEACGPPDYIIAPVDGDVVAVGFVVFGNKQAELTFIVEFVGPPEELVCGVIAAVSLENSL